MKKIIIAIIGIVLIPTTSFAMLQLNSGGANTTAYAIVSTSTNYSVTQISQKVTIKNVAGGATAPVVIKTQLTSDQVKLVIQLLRIFGASENMINKISKILYE